MTTNNRPLRVFLCHSSNDKPAVRELYEKLNTNGIDAWLDEKKLLPGQYWKKEIPKAVRNADVVVICLSKTSISKEGYIQREIKFALDIALEKREGTIYLIPAKLEVCQVPDSLSDWQWVNLFEPHGVDLLFKSLESRAASLGLSINIHPLPQEQSSKAKLAQQYYEVRPELKREQNSTEKYLDDYHSKHAKKLEELVTDKMTLSNGMEFMRVPAGKFLMGSIKENKIAFDAERPQHIVDIPYDYWMGRFPIINGFYNTYVKSIEINHPVSDWKKRIDHPVVWVTWTDAVKYCQWLNIFLQKELSSGLCLRLPTEAEWEKAARGTDGREYPWSNEFDKNKCNTMEGGEGSTTSVGLYSPQGDSPYCCADMAGNVWEWTHSLKKEYPYQSGDGREDEKASGIRVLRGGSFNNIMWNARCAYRDDYDILKLNYRIIGFRVCLAPSFSQ